LAELVGNASDVQASSSALELLMQGKWSRLSVEMFVTPCGHGDPEWHFTFMGDFLSARLIRLSTVSLDTVRNSVPHQDEMFTLANNLAVQMTVLPSTRHDQAAGTDLTLLWSHRPMQLLITMLEYWQTNPLEVGLASPRLARLGF
jgi:hypothetical protein